jgi:ParB-like chromosome segregation protein Spo0J
MLRWATIEAKIIATESEAEAAVKGLIENLQREDLNAIEEAEGVKELLAMKGSGWTLAKAGEAIGRDKGYVSRSLKLLELPEAVIEKLRQRNLSREHGIELLRIDNTNRLKSVAKKAAEGAWPVKKLREYIDRLLNPPPRSPRPVDAFPSDPLAAAWRRLEPSTLANCRITPAPGTPSPGLRTKLILIFLPTSLSWKKVLAILRWSCASEPAPKS